MAGNSRRFVKRFFIFLNILAAVIFLIACIGPYLNPAEWWMLTFAGLGFALVFTLLVLFALFWIIFRPRYVFISLVALLIGI